MRRSLSAMSRLPSLPFVAATPQNGKPPPHRPQCLNQSQRVNAANKEEQERNKNRKMRKNKQKPLEPSRQTKTKNSRIFSCLSLEDGPAA